MTPRSPLPCALALLVACGDSSSSDTAQITPPGSSGQSGTSGSSGQGGASGAGLSGASGKGGSAGGGQGGSGGLAGQGGAGQAGSAQAGAGQGGQGGGGAGGASGAGAGGAGQGGAGGAGQGGQGGAGAGGGGAGGAGAAGAGGAGQGGGGSGGGGQGGACDVLIAAGDPVEVGFEPWQIAFNPSLQMLPNGELLIGAKVLPNESPGPVPPTLRFATLEDPLGPWPTQPIAGMEFEQEGAGSSYRLLGLTPGDMGFLYRQEGAQDTVGPVIRGSYGVSSSIPPKKLLFEQATEVLSWAQGEPGTLFAAADVPLGGPGKHRLRVLKDTLQGAGAPVDIPSGSGCATAPLVADALWRGDHLLLALSSSRKALSCDDDNGVDGPPKQVQLLRQGGQGGPEVMFEAELDSEVRFLRLLPRGEGAWLVQGKSEDGFQLPLSMIPITAEGFPGAALLDLTEGALVPVRPSVAAMDDQRVAVAYVEEGGQVPHFRLRTVGLSGSSQTVEVGAIFATATALASPSPDTVIVAWTGGGFDAKLKLARFRCAKAE